MLNRPNKGAGSPASADPTHAARLLREARRRGEAASSAGDWRAAARLWRDIVDRFPDPPVKAYLRLAAAHRQLGQFAEAADVAEAGLGVHPNQRLIMREHAEAASAMEDWPAAIARWQALIDHGGDVPAKAYVRLAAALAKVGDIPGAERVLREGATAHPRNTAIAQQLTELAAARLPPHEAVRRWQRVLDLSDSPQPRTFRQLAAAHAALGEVVEAAAVLDRGAAKYPADDRIALDRALLASAMSDWPKAEDLWGAFVRRDGDRASPVAFARLAAAFRGQAKLHQARLALRRAAAIHRDNPALNAEAAELFLAATGNDRTGRGRRFAARVFRRLAMSRGMQHGARKRLLRRLEIAFLRYGAAWMFEGNGRERRARITAHVRSGGRDGAPNLYFDAEYYRLRHRLPPDLPISPATHFALYGAAQHLNPSPWFDYRVYLTANADLDPLSIDPYRHFVEHGARADRWASTHFDPEYYARLYPDAVASGEPLLAFHIRRGEAEGRRARPPFNESRQTRDRHQPELPEDLEQAILALPRRATDAPPVDVVVPVYRDSEATLSCLWHVLRSANETPFELIVIDDCSPEPGLSAALRRLAEAGAVHLLVNERNLGYVASVNRGMALHPDRDIVLLNADTECYGDWLDRLRAAALGRPDCATVTPLTNSGTICSYPYFVTDNEHTLELSFEELDAIARHENRGAVVEAPTSVGFCTYIKRTAIDAIGPFDVEAFGRGYGEENDFSLRAQSRGWTDLIATDVFVRHLGGASFGQEKRNRIAAAMKAIDARYPDYLPGVHRYIAADPVRPFRAAIDLARLRRLKRARNILVISHGRGGGTEQHISEELARLTPDATMFRMAIDPMQPSAVRHFHPEAPDVPNLPSLDLRSDADAILRMWNLLEITEIHVHHIADFPATGASDLLALLHRSGRPWQVTIHDYLAICPRINLIDEDGLYCGEPPPEGCRICLTARRSEFGAPDILAWREAHGALLAGAGRRIVPSADAAERLRRYFPEMTFEIVPHDEAQSAPPPVRIRPDGSPLRVATLGAISKLKGFDVLLACAEEARIGKRALRYLVVGYTEAEGRAHAAGIRTTGRYRNHEAPAKIAEEEADVIFLTSRWPETYSYTLSIAIESGLPIVAFDIGAYRERLAASGARYALLPLDASPAVINTTIEALAMAPVPTD